MEPSRRGPLRGDNLRRRRDPSARARYDPSMRFMLIGFALLVAGCSSLVQTLVQEPKVSFNSVSVRDAKQEGATAVIALNIENPNGVSLTVDRLKYALELGGKPIASHEVLKIATIAAHATTKVEVPVPFRYDEVFSSVLDLISKGSAVYKVKGEASIGLFTLPFDHSGDLKLRE